MNGVWKLNCVSLIACVVGVVTVSAHAQAVSEKEIAGIDKRFAIASERVDQDRVKLHSRKDTDGGSVHQVHTFSCIDETYEILFEGEAVPKAYPDVGNTAGYRSLEQNSEQRAMASHACQEHGFPALRMEW